MPIIPWRTFRNWHRFFDDNDWLLPLNDDWKIMEPEMDVYETNNEVIAEINLPGIDPQKIDVSVKDQILKVSGGMTKEKEDKEKGYWRKEIRKGAFERMIKLPVPIKEADVNAVYSKGILKITMPKLSEAKETKKIEVKEE
jgi:HSP20 family protein